MADPPWRFQNSTGKVAPEHKRLSRYGTMSFAEIMELPVASVADSVPISISGSRTPCCPKGSPSSKPGASHTNPISSGTRFARTAARTGEGSGSIFETSQNSFSSACEGRTRGRSRPAADKSTSCRQGSGSTPANQTSNTRSSKPARRDRFWNCSGAGCEGAGPYGAIRPTKATLRPGRPTRIIQGRRGPSSTSSTYSFGVMAKVRMGHPPPPPPSIFGHSLVWCVVDAP